jgi:16S rRNA (cytosine1402-N4)-methyltransferase
MFTHQSVLLNETIEGVCPNEMSDGVFVDGTFGRGGHARALLSRLSSQARLIVIDQDLQAIEVALALAQTDSRVTVVHAGFGSMLESLAQLGVTAVDGVMLDLGVSSPQIDDGARGFSFMRDGPLDMRMNTTQGQTAAEWLATADVEEIKGVIKRYGEERFALQIAKAIVARCATDPINTTLELAGIIASAVRTREKGQHPATRTFQAIRIHVNRELEELDLALEATLTLLKTGARMAVISFHSLEDRVVKQFMAAAARPEAALARLPIRESDLPQPVLTELKRVLTSDQEIDANTRARSAVLRIATRTATPLPAKGAREFLPQLSRTPDRSFSRRGR